MLLAQHASAVPWFPSLREAVMKTSMVSGGVALAIALAAAPAQAQFVEAGVVIRSGPVYGHVVVGEPAVVYRRPVRRVVVVERYRPREIVVERVRAPRGHAYGWWRRNGYRAATVFYDADDDCYYDRPVAGRGVRAVSVYWCDGRYYAWDRDWRGGRDWDD
jgi:hypothetical protein